MTKARVPTVLVATAALAAAAYFLPLGPWTTALAERARGAGAAGMAILGAAYVVATVAFLPGSLLTLAAGFAYGPVLPSDQSGAERVVVVNQTLAARYFGGEDPIGRVLHTTSSSARSSPDWSLDHSSSASALRVQFGAIGGDLQRVVRAIAADRETVIAIRDL
jgi:hypothetical protein